VNPLLSLIFQQLFSEAFKKKIFLSFAFLRRPFVVVDEPPLKDFFDGTSTLKAFEFDLSSSSCSNSEETVFQLPQHTDTLLAFSFAHGIYLLLFGLSRKKD
jgi:hypothetical protein